MMQNALIRPAWTPATIALMVLGFIIHPVLGLGMLAYIIWGDRLPAFKSEMRQMKDRVFDGGCASFSSPMPRTGNVAFDEWRESELERLARERRRLDQMRAEFDDYARELRRAKDKEEFDRFMASRRDRDARDEGNNKSIDL